MSRSGEQSGHAERGQTSGNRTEGKPLGAGAAMYGASRKKGVNRSAERSESDDRSVRDGAPERRAQEADKANAGEERE